MGEEKEERWWSVEGGKVHRLKKTGEFGEHFMACGLVQQEPFKKSSKSPSCYGCWLKTENPVTCLSCLRMTTQESVGG